MAWYILAVLVGFGIVIGSWHLWCKYRLKDNTFDVIMENKVRFIKTILAAFLIVTVLCSPHLWGMSKCATRSVVHNMHTQYSWIYCECQFQTADGSFVSFDRIRGLPNGDTSVSE